MELLCECNGFDCQKTIDIPFEKAKEIKRIPSSIIIVDGCSTGSDASDTFVKKELGYSIYIERKKS